VARPCILTTAPWRTLVEPRGSSPKEEAGVRAGLLSVRAMSQPRRLVATLLTSDKPALWSWHEGNFELTFITYGELFVSFDDVTNLHQPHGALVMLFA
jgi:hypothetical protein